LTLGLALTLPCVGAWAQVGSGAAAGTVQPETAQSNGMERQQGQMLARGSMWATDTIHTPLQEFVSLNVHEVGELSRQFDVFRANDRPEMAQMLYHMVRDHVLVSDAAQNVLARRGDVSKPVILMSQQPMPTSPDELVRHNIAMHEMMLERTREMMANANSPEERGIYETAIRATEKHLQWLRGAEQGQPVRLGFFSPTMPLSLIAGYREEIGGRNGANGTRRYRNGANGMQQYRNNGTAR
jgi:hypothetical protein